LREAGATVRFTVDVVSLVGSNGEFRGGRDPASRSDTTPVLVVFRFLVGSDVVFVSVNSSSRLVALAQYLTGVEEKVEWPQPRSMYKR
jgi:hypothetical protein